MKKLTFVIPTLLGVEGLTAEELRRLEMEEVRVENGRVFCQGTQGYPPPQPEPADRGAGAVAAGQLPGPGL